ncbi:hypothetical protein ACWGI8_19940 [Streptomyces sp. NPDC054841]
MRLRLDEFRPRTGPHTYRIVQPRHPLRHTTLNDPLHDRWGYLLGDHDGLSRLAGLFAFVAFSRHTVVHVPLRESLPRTFSPGVPVDIVLVHHSLGLRPSRWPGLRAGLRHGTPLTVRTDERRTAARAAAWRKEWEDHNWRSSQWLRPAVHARTLFLFGSRDVFAEAATCFEEAAGNAPLSKHAAKGIDVLGSSLSPLFEPDHRWDRPELDIGFQAYPPYRHFRPPGRPASRRSRTAASC